MIAEEDAAGGAAVEEEARHQEPGGVCQVAAAEVPVEAVQVVAEAAVPEEEVLDLCPGRK